MSQNSRRIAMKKHGTVSESIKFRDVSLGREGGDLISLSNILEMPDCVRDAQNTPGQTAPQTDGMAQGRWTYRSLRPGIFYCDCDFVSVSDDSVVGVYEPNILLSMTFAGGWDSVVDGKTISVGRPGMPSLMCTKEAVELSTSPRIGQKCNLASLQLSLEFLQGLSDHEEDAALEVLTRMDPERPYFARELPGCYELGRVLRCMYTNPYHGMMGKLFEESLALSGIVALARYLSHETARTASASALQKRRAEDAKTLIDAKALGSDFSVAWLAREVGVSETSLRRAFKARLGITVMEHVRNLRLDAAHLLLREGGLRVSQVAYRVGYSNPANFATAFRRRFGCPPGRRLN